MSKWTILAISILTPLVFGSGFLAASWSSLMDKKRAISEYGEMQAKHVDRARLIMAFYQGNVDEASLDLSDPLIRLAKADIAGTLDPLSEVAWDGPSRVSPFELYFLVRYLGQHNPSSALISKKGLQSIIRGVEKYTHAEVQRAIMSGDFMERDVWAEAEPQLAHFIPLPSSQLNPFDSVSGPWGGSSQKHQ